MVWAALSVILALVITSVSANSSTSWNLAASAASAISPANNTPDNARPECTNASTWATPNFRPSDCYGALSRFHASRIVPPYRAVRTEFLIPGDRKRTELPSSVLPEQFVYQTCTIKLFITRYYMGAAFRHRESYPRTEVATYGRIYRRAVAIFQNCVTVLPSSPIQSRSTGFSFAGPDQGILIVIWDTDSAANMPYKTLGDSTVNASSIASVEPLVASSYLRTMNSIAPGSSMTTIATPMVSDIPPVRPVTGVPGLLNGGPMESAPVEAA